MHSLGTLEIHTYSTKREYLGRWHPDFTEKEDFLELLRGELREDGFCDLAEKLEVEALGLPCGSPNPLTCGEIICHLVPTEHSNATSLPAGTIVYVIKAIVGNPNLSKPISCLNLSRRAETALRSCCDEIRTVQDVVRLNGNGLIKLRGAGYNTKLEVRSALLALGLKLDDSWKLPKRFNEGWQPDH